jgi:3'(2'), 5'-bisphosphate nucleotidase
MILSPSDIDQLLSVAQEAGRRIMPYFQAEHGARKKEDRSPVTDADMAAHDYILSALKKFFPHIPVISEEDALPADAAPGRHFFLVDPLDGTRSFVRGEAEFSVNIALVEGERPVYGVIGLPPSGEVYYGGAGKAFRDGAPIRARKAPQEGVTLTRSRSSPSAAASHFMKTLNIREILPSSSAVKLCWLAEGKADIYPRFGRTMEWDTAAGHAILEAAGGRITTVEGTPLIYGKPGFENPGFIAYGA